MLECKEWILCSFWGGGLRSGGVMGCLFVVDFCDDLGIYVFYNDV